MQELMPTINTPDNVFHDGDPTTGAFGTIVPALWLNNTQFAIRDLQQECKNILTKAGFTPDPRKQNQLAEAISQLIKISVPAAAVGRSGIVSLSNAVYSNSETDAATSRAVKTVYDSAIAANQNANTRLEKSKNGADILDKQAFVKNLGLSDTVKLGDYGIGTVPIGYPSITTIADANSLTVTGWYGGGGFNAKNYYNTHAPIMVMTRHGSGDNRGVVAQFQVDSAGMATRYLEYGQWSKWNIAWGTVNTTVIDGFIKKASPIITIWNDGKFETNDESEGAVVERLSEGVYLIKNVLGFNADAAWGGADGGVEIPLCKNKLPLIWVDYKVLSDGSIKLMTYHREHANAPAFARNVREGYADGDLIDIPHGRSVSVRVQMPENSIWNQRQRKLTEAE
ncbi:phage tail protein [Xenorhabdus miraniensis]|uniref:Tail protein n=1 Tax=Xenorhabdus miraniensis TaxID=351674 RepID=A0A2D0JLB4_9GAMM|nr:phage tail protein [Xenorhabdus miraniensis]PHM47077.1 tail protein [Xenorhabdus miraniensis]